jgi:hypothetical protein
MIDQEQKKDSTNITPQPNVENKKESGELNEEDLKKATGGTPTTTTTTTTTTKPKTYMTYTMNNVT